MNDGIIVVNKPKGYTSRDIVNIVGNKFKTKKVGHTGTLDPLATGVLVLCLNKATKISELLVCDDKEYIASFYLGMLTDTLDVTGHILKEQTIDITIDEVNRALVSMLGFYEQEVPIYSAVKIGGTKLYEYARNGKTVELPKRKVEIKNIELLEYRISDNKPILKIKTRVSKGTYIRSLGNDIARKLGTYATMMELVRTKQGIFNLENSYSIDDILNDNYEIISIEKALPYTGVEMSDELYFKINNGAIIDNIYNHDVICFLKNKKIKAIYKKYDKDNAKMKPWKML